MSSERLTWLVTKQLSGALTPDEAAELNSLLQNGELAERYRLLRQFLSTEKIELADTAALWQRVAQAISKEEELPAVGKRRILPKTGLSLITAMLLLGAGFWWWQMAPPAKDKTGPTATARPLMLKKENEKGTRSVITLADGSKVWLNADSRLQYPPHFEGGSREVSLSGEAFFEVARNAQKPFIIHLAGGTVKVLGTSFNIKAYPGENRIETSVATGKVAFIPAQKGSDTTFLTPNRKAVYTLDKAAVKTLETIASEDKGWTEGKLTFHSASMSEISVALERYFGKQVVINDEEIASYRLTGYFENNSAEEILYYLSKVKPFTYRITETQIILSLVR